MALMRKAAALAAVAVLGLGLAACGDDDDSSALDDRDAATTEDTEDTGAGDDTDDRDDGDDGSTGGLSGNDVDLGELQDVLGGECMAFAQAMMVVGAPMASMFGGGDMEAEIEQAGEYFAEVAKNVPAELKEDFDVLAEAFEAFAKGLADAGIDFEDPATFTNPDAMAKLEPAMKALESPRFEAAGENIERWLDENCSSEE
ncbi:MAG TPA: hypothetical protein VK007_12960 [Acidimicrobiales bacterium]|nr:hypothetical protein [Acidimicrobiales bacterium]